MSSLTGLAQFSNRFAQNIMGYQEGKKREAERVADKEYERDRQAAIDTRAQESHDLQQKKGNILIEDSQLTLDQNKTKNKAFNDKQTYENTINQVKQLKAIGADDEQSIDIIMGSVNSNSKLPYTLQVERGQDGKVIARQDENGNTFYFQSIIDKETGEELGRKATTVDDMMNSYTQLQRGGAIEAEQQAAAAARKAKLQEMQDKLTLKAGEAKIDQSKYAANKSVDHDYAMKALGVENVLELEKLAIEHGYALEELDRQTVNRISQDIAQSDINSGGTPIVGTGNGPAWGSFDALIGPESNGQQLNSKGQPLTSSAGAIGIAQVMPATARYVSSKNGIKWDENRYKTDPDYNYQLGKLYYEEQLNKFGHPALAYAAYNAGPGAVEEWIEKNPAMANPNAMGIDNFVRAIPYKETRNYVAKIHRQSGGVQVARSVPALPKSSSSKTGKAGQSGRGITSPQAFNERVDKGVGSALKVLKNDMGIKPGPAESAYISQAGRKVKDMVAAKNYQEFMDLYGEAADLVIQAIPDRERKKLNQRQVNALQHRIIAQMTGASSLGNFKQMIFDLNPNAVGKAGTAGSGITNPFYQEPKTTTARTPARSGSTQVPKLAALYARGNRKPVETDPQAEQTMQDLNNLNDSIDW